MMNRKRKLAKHAQWGQTRKKKRKTETASAQKKGKRNEGGEAKRAEWKFNKERTELKDHHRLNRQGNTD